MPKTDAERIATLETERAHLQTMLEEVRGDVKAIKAQLSNQKGFIAGASMVAGLVWTALVFSVSHRWDRVSGSWLTPLTSAIASPPRAWRNWQRPTGASAPPAPSTSRSAPPLTGVRAVSARGRLTLRPRGS